MLIDRFMPEFEFVEHRRADATKLPSLLAARCPSQRVHQALVLEMIKREAETFR